MDNKEQKKPVFLAWIILLIIILGGAGFGIFWYVNYFSYISTDKASIESPKVSVSSKIMGRVKNLYVDEGKSVVIGQVLMELDDTDLLAQKAQTEASVNLSEQNLNLAKVNLEKMQKDFDRIKKLNSAGAVTSEQYEHAEDGLKASNVQYAISEAQLGISKAQLDTVNTQLLNTKITAPVDGVISKKSIMQGEIIQPSMPVVVITDLKNVWITANFEETKISLIQPKQKVEVSVDAYPNHKLIGHVDSISSAIVPPPLSIGDTTKTIQKIPVKILLDNIPESMILLPGMSVVVKIKVK